MIFAFLKIPKMTEEFPTVEGGGLLILAWQIRQKIVLVVGGGEVSPLRILSVRTGIDAILI